MIGLEMPHDTELPLVYDELRRIAAAHLRRERAGHTLQPTALVHEAYLRLLEQSGQFHDETHFRATASRVMRQILVDHARRRGADKRGGGWLRVALCDDEVGGAADRDVEILALDEALEELGRLDERKSRVVEMRFFGGMTCSEAAVNLGVSPKTAEADWYMARAWLHRRLSG
jgi:RNA polymerase sigma factor (TIGR02999 family)